MYVYNWQWLNPPISCMFSLVLEAYWLISSILWVLLESLIHYVYLTYMTVQSYSTSYTRLHSFSSRTICRRSPGWSSTEKAHWWGWRRRGKNELNERKKKHEVYMDVPNIVYKYININIYIYIYIYVCIYQTWVAWWLRSQPFITGWSERCINLHRYVPASFGDECW